MASSGTLLVTTVKNEGPTILEWVAHHRLCGFDRIMVFQNDSTDFTTRTLRILDQLGVIAFRQNVSRNPQIAAYRAASESEAFQSSEWCMALDGDEFLNVHVGDHRVEDVIEAVGPVDQIHLNWRLFGAGGQTELSQELVTERFTRAERIEDRGGKMRGFKTLFRTASFSRIGIHRPRYPMGAEATAANGSGLREGEFILGNWRSSDPGEMSLAQVNHYATRDAASFLLKVRRGRAHQAHNALDDKYWRTHNRNEDVDPRLARRSDALKAEMARLDELSDGRLMQLRRKAFRRWRQDFGQVMQDEGAQALYRSLKSFTPTEKSPA